MKIKFFKASLSLLLAISAVFALVSCKPTKQYSETYYNYFDTFTYATVSSSSKKEAERFFSILEDELNKYHRLLDIYEVYDGITNLKSINDNAGIAPTPVIFELIEIIEFSKDLYEETSGYINIAMGSVLRIWHEHRYNSLHSPDLASLPDISVLQEAAEHTNINDIIIDKENSTVFLNDADMSIDVGAVGKGYATQKISDSLKKNGFENFVINIGGNVLACGIKTENKPWSVAIEDPADTKELLLKLDIQDMSVVTSGSYQRYFDLNGIRYHHIIDPYSLMPKNDYLSVTVIHKDPAVADAMSTALFNMPYEVGYKTVCEYDGLEAVWVFSDGNVEYSDNFNQYIAK